MSPRPTGRLDGNDLIMTRTFRAPIDDVWTSITDPASTARWIGPWEGEPGQGKTVRLKMAFEEGDHPWTNVRIDVCDRPRHLAVTTLDGSGEWRLEVKLVQEGDTTTLTFVHHLSDRKLVGEIGPGWEYYLDMLVAARAGQPLPKFADYYPAQKAHYLGES